MTGFVRGGVLAAVLLLGIGACASAGTSSPETSTSPGTSTSPSPTATRQAVTMTRSGGLAGSRDRVLITPDGAWTRTDRAGTQTRGQLSADQITALQRLANDPKLPSEAAPPIAKVTCADGLTYSINVGTETVSYTDCSSVRPQITAQMVGLISTWTLK